MKYFLHDSNAFNDEKITELYISFGYEGIGLFFTILEKIAQQEKPIKTDVLKHQLKVGKKLEKCWLFLENIGLICSLNGETFNEQLLNFSEKYKIKSEKNAKRISQWREKQSVSKNVTHYESVRNTPKVNRSKVNRSKENNNSIFSFDDFWKKYPVKVGKDVCRKKFESLSDSDLQTIKDTIDDFIKYKPFDKYNHPNPSTYLNQKRWFDELSKNESDDVPFKRKVVIDGNSIKW